MGPIGLISLIESGRPFQNAKTAAPEISGAAVPKVPFRRFPTPA
jgi:hypothetical protein